MTTAVRSAWIGAAAVVIAAVIGACASLWKKEPPEKQAPNGMHGNGTPASASAPNDKHPALVRPSPLTSEPLEQGQALELVLTFDEPIVSCSIDGKKAVVKGSEARLSTQVPGSGEEWTVAWTAKGKSGESKGQLKYAVPDRLDTIEIHVVTTNEDKECGAFVVKLLSGGNQVFRKEYGHIEDGVCGGSLDEDWHDGRDLRFVEGFAPRVLVGADPLQVKVALEERNGEVNILWHSSIEVVVKTNHGRRLAWSSAVNFDTDGGRTADEQELGSAQHF